MDKKYFLREEAFGYTFFDRKKLRHKFIKKDDLDDFLLRNKIEATECSFISLKGKNIRKNILCAPIRIYYELTLKCNLHCKFCFNSSGKPRLNELNTKEIFKNLHDLKKIGVMDIRFTGGEFTCRDDWYEIFFEAKKLGFSVSCNTNAAYSDPNISRKLASLELEQITISIDGRKENHEKNRGLNTFDRTIKNIDMLYKLGARLRFNTLVSKYSINDAPSIIELASKYTDEINFFTIVFIGRGKNLENECSVTEQEHLEMSETIEKLKTLYPKLNILHFSKVSKETAIRDDISRQYGLKTCSPSGATTLNIMSDGSVWCGGYVAYIDKKMCLGNIKDNDVFDIWQNSKILEKIRDDSGRLIYFCNECDEFKKNRCQGSKYETELERLLRPKTKNPWYIYGDGPSLLSVSEKYFLDKKQKLPYRNNVAAIIFKGNDYLLVQQNDWQDIFWKFPQGGVDSEEKELDAVLRELKEELGTNKFKILGKSKYTNKYDWSDYIIEKTGFRWRGQFQKFFFVEFLGKDDDIEIEDNELRRYKWVNKSQIKESIDHNDQLFVNYFETVKKVIYEFQKIKL